MKTATEGKSEEEKNKIVDEIASNVEKSDSIPVPKTAKNIEKDI